MAKRSSVSVLAGERPMGAKMSENESCSVDVRCIDNGYIIRETRCKGDQYQSKEVYSKTKPDLDAATRAPTNAGREGLRDAMRELRRK